MVQVSNTPYVTVRIKFKKVGRLQYISHLDLVRTMQKILVRSKLPMWYTEGFNPKPKMVFAAPLSIGAESMCEFMDLRLTDKISPDEIKAVLNKNMTDEMQVTEVYYPTSKLTDLKWLSYTIKIRSELNPEQLAQKCNQLFTKDEILVTKKGKDSDKTINIKPLIRSADAVNDGDCVRISAVLSADQSCFLNPEYLISALRTEFSILTPEREASESYSIMRTFPYREDMSEFC